MSVFIAIILFVGVCLVFFGVFTTSVLLLKHEISTTLSVRIEHET